MPIWLDGTVINPSGGLPLKRLSGAIPTSYTIFEYDGTYYAECNIPSGTNYSDSDVDTVVQAAKDALTSGGKIFFKQGIYPFSEDLVIDKSRIVLEGECKGSYVVGNAAPKGVTLQFTSSHTKGIYIHSATGTVEGITLKHLTLEDQNSTIDQAVYWHDTSWCFMEDVDVHYINKAGAWTVKCYEANLYMNDCHLWNVTNGLQVSNPASGNAEIKVKGGLFALASGGTGASFTNVSANLYDVILEGYESGGTGVYVAGNTGKIVNCCFLPSSPAGTDINIASGTGNLVTGNTLNTITDSGTNTIIRGNPGYVTENGGTVTLTNGTTEKSVTHGCSYTPNAQDIDVHPIETLNNAGYWWVDTITSTTFKIKVDGDPGQDVDFKWSVRRI